MDAEVCKQQHVDKGPNNCRPRDIYHVIPLHSVIVFLLGTLASAVVLDIIPVQNCLYLNRWSRLWDTSEEDNNGVSNISPTYTVYGNSQNENHLIHVVNVLERFGYRRVGFGDDWNLLWAHDYPFFKNPSLKNIGTHQVVNHLPGCGFITNKVDLSTTPLPFLPTAFRLPSQKAEFLEYSRQNPGTLFVEKHNEHRYIAIRAPGEINLHSNDSFIQEFIPNSFLVDGHKFDIGVYVVVTSVNPLRVYIYSGDVLFRYCPVRYHPFNASEIDKYVVGDDYLPTWKVPSLIKYYQRLGGSMRGAFDAYVREQHLNPSTIWTQVEDIVRQTIMAKEQDIVGILRSYKTHNFFELMRFDLIIDDTLKVHLMEANMSPNLSSAHFKPNSLLYEQILYSVLNLIGIGSPVRTESPLNQREKSKKLQTQQRQFEIIIDFMVQHSDLAKGQLQSVNARVRSNNLWTKLADDLNSNGPPVRDIPGWKKVWSDLKTHTKVKMRRNKLSISSTGGGVSQYCPLSSMEEQLINLLHMEEAVNGLPKSACFGTSSNNSTVSEELIGELLESAQNEDVVPKETVHAAKRSCLDENLQASKRSRVSNQTERDNLLKTQVENQGVYQSESTKLLGEVRNSLKDLVRFNRKTFELKEKKLAFSKEKFKFKKEYKLQKQKLAVEKLELKKKMLELQIEKSTM